MKYDLASINSTTFQNLAAALCLSEFGQPMHPMGSGSDGGIDILLPDYKHRRKTENQLKGTGIAQAKCKESPNSTNGTSGTWLIQRLKESLDALEQHDDESYRKPYLYIVITNVALSPKPNVGGHSKVMKFLQEQSSSGRFTSFLLWDANAICSLIDANPSIQTSFAEFTTPSTVLYDLMHPNHKSHQLSDELTTMFLINGLKACYNPKLSQAGYTDSTNSPLEHLFIDVPATEHSVQPPTSNPYLQEQENLKKAKQHNSFNVVNQILLKGNNLHSSKFMPECNAKSSNRIAIVGGPGQGKSTLCQYLALVHRARLLTSRVHLSPPEITAQCSSILQHLQCENRTFSPRIPFLVDLKLLSEYLGTVDSTEGVKEYLHKQFETAVANKVNISEFLVWIQRNSVIFLFDGLDEVPQSGNRGRLLAGISQFVTEYIPTMGIDALSVMTTRPQGYSDELLREHYDHWTLSPLPIVLAKRYAELLVVSRHSHRIEEQQKLLNRFQFALQEPAIKFFLETPLLVTLIIQLIETNGDVPNNRWKLFDEYVRAMFHRERERGTPFSQVLRTHEQIIVLAHRNLAFRMQSQSESLKNSKVTVSEQDLLSEISRLLIDKGHLAEEIEKIKSHLMKSVTDRLVFLEVNADYQYSFGIRSIQEYFACEFLSLVPEAQFSKHVNTLVPLSYWRNVFSLMASRLIQDRDYLFPIMLQALRDWNSSENHPQLPKLALGSAIAMQLIEDQVGQSTPIVSKNLSSIAAIAAVAEILPVEVQKNWATFCSLYKEWIPLVEARLSNKKIKEPCPALQIVATVALWNSKDAGRACLEILSGTDVQVRRIALAASDSIDMEKTAVKKAWQFLPLQSLSILDPTRSSIELFVQRDFRYVELVLNGRSTYISIALGDLSDWLAIDSYSNEDERGNFFILNQIKGFIREQGLTRLDDFLEELFKERIQVLNSVCSLYLPWQIDLALRTCLFRLKGKSSHESPFDLSYALPLKTALKHEKLFRRKSESLLSINFEDWSEGDWSINGPLICFFLSRPLAHDHDTKERDKYSTETILDDFIPLIYPFMTDHLKERYWITIARTTSNYFLDNFALKLCQYDLFSKTRSGRSYELTLNSSFLILRDSFAGFESFKSVDFEQFRGFDLSLLNTYKFSMFNRTKELAGFECNLNNIQPITAYLVTCMHSDISLAQRLIMACTSRGLRSQLLGRAIALLSIRRKLEEGHDCEPDFDLLQLSDRCVPLLWIGDSQFRTSFAPHAIRLLCEAILKNPRGTEDLKDYLHIGFDYAFRNAVFELPDMN